VLGRTVIQGGEGPNGGTAVNGGGEGPNGGTVINGGQDPNGGAATNNGQGPNGGTATDRGQGPSNGNTSLPGNGPNTSDSENETSWLYKTIDSGLNLAKQSKGVGPTRQRVISFLSERQDSKMISSRNMISGVKDGYLIVMAMII